MQTMGSVLTVVKANLESGHINETDSACLRASLVAQMVKHLPARWETSVRSLGWEDLRKKETATHSSTLAWEIPRTGGAWVPRPWGRKESDTTERLHFHFHPHI